MDTKDNQQKMPNRKNNNCNYFIINKSDILFAKLELLTNERVESTKFMQPHKIISLPNKL